MFQLWANYHSDALSAWAISGVVEVRQTSQPHSQSGASRMKLRHRRKLKSPERTAPKFKDHFDTAPFWIFISVSGWQQATGCCAAGNRCQSRRGRIFMVGLVFRRSRRTGWSRTVPAPAILRIGSRDKKENGCTRWANTCVRRCNAFAGSGHPVSPAPEGNSRRLRQSSPRWVQIRAPGCIHETPCSRS